jgi:hypothetical protein
MQRQAYQDRLLQAAQVLEQPPGGSTGSILGDASQAVATG